MNISINEIGYEIPFDPMVITLDQYAEYQKKFGKSLDEDLQIIKEKYTQKNYDFDQMDLDIDMDNHLDKEALCWFSFWTKLDLEDLMDCDDALPLLVTWRQLRHLFEGYEYKIPVDIEWNGELWSIQNYMVNPESKMTFNEVITSKEVMRQCYKLGMGKWEAMPYLCSVFFRKKDEAFSDNLVYENGERMSLMKTLPLAFGLMVGFFLSVSINFAKNSLASLIHQEEEKTKIARLN